MKGAIIAVPFAAVVALTVFLGDLRLVSADNIAALGEQGLPDADVATIKQTIEAWTDAFVKDDLDTWDTYWAEDGVLMPPGHTRLTGDAERNAYIQKHFSYVAKSTFADWDVVGRDDLAVATNNITWNDSSGGKAVMAKQIIVLRLHDDKRWLIQSVIFNLND